VIPVTQADVELALDGAELTVDQVGDPSTGKLAARVQRASDLVEGYLGQEYLPGDTVPQIVVRVAAGAVARLYVRDAQKGVPMFQDSKTAGMGPFSATVKYADGATSNDPWLTKADKMKLTNIFSGYQTSEMESDRGYPSCDAIEVDDR
jgi:hypothetical protein